MRKLWGEVLFLGAFFLFLAPGSMPARAQGMDRSRPYGSDYLTFAEELRTQGALGFYDQTEDILRAGKFSRAFTRYLFLRANIRGQSLYAGLASSVDQRLQFLKEQMHLGEGALQYEYRETYAQKRRRRPKPACPPPKKTAKPKEQNQDEKPPEAVIPGQSLEEKAQATPPAKEGTKAAAPETKPPGQETKPAGEAAKKPADGAQKPPTGTQKPVPAPPLSFWEKFKLKLKFW
jgi:hypothetical protein